MLITNPLPEEFSTGHLGRLMRINGMTAPRLRAYKFLAAASSKDRGKQDSPLHAMAELLGMDPATYARRHTLLPFHSFAFRSDLAGHHAHWRTAHYRRFGFSAINPHAVFCPECVAEDEQFWGFSYWRREHQVLGTRWCSRHGVRLLHTADTNAFFSLPGEWIDHAEPYAIGELLDTADEAVRRYQEVASLMLEQGAPESLDRMRNHIAKQAQAIGLVLSECAHGNRLTSDRILQAFPPEWLRETFPRAGSKRLGRFCNVFDNALKPVRSGTVGAPAMAGVLAVLFDDPATAIQTICSGSEPTATWSEGRPGKSGTASTTTGNGFSRVSPPLPGSTRHLARTFLDCQGNLAAIAKSLGCSLERAHWLLARRRKHIVEALRKAPESIALSAFLGGLSLAEASTIHGVPLPTLEAMLRYLHTQLAVPKATRMGGVAADDEPREAPSRNRRKRPAEVIQN